MKTESQKRMDHFRSLGIIERSFEDRMEETFGPNPCQRAMFGNLETGTILEAPCQSKGCPDCGSRLAFAFWTQTVEMFGRAAWIGRISGDDFEKTIESRRKAHVRGCGNRDEEGRHRRDCSGKLRYQIQDDLLVSEEPLIESQRLMELGPWRERIVKAWQLGKRLRRTLGIVLSGVTKREGRGSAGQWQRFSGKMVQFVKEMRWQAAKLGRVGNGSGRWSASLTLKPETRPRVSLQ